jgi:hypothetical protein
VFDAKNPSNNRMRRKIYEIMVQTHVQKSVAVNVLGGGNGKGTNYIRALAQRNAR